MAGPASIPSVKVAELGQGGRSLQRVAVSMTASGARAFAGSTARLGHARTS